jgi:diguanylate cyclase (GGDEF)-like protein/PAS domain S-box-containing protein
VGATFLIGLVIGFNWINVSTSRLLDRTNGTLGAAGEASTTVANVIREAGFVELAATQLPDRAQFDAALLHHALFLRQIDITRAAVAGNLAIHKPAAELDRRSADLEDTFTSLGTDPTRAELSLARDPLRKQAKALELAAKQLYDASESNFLLQSRNALAVQRQYQIALIGMGLFSTLIAAGLLISLRSRAGKDLTKAYDELLTASQSRQLAEDGLRRSSDRFRALVHNATDVITVVDGDLRISYQSPSVMGVLGRRAVDLIGMDFLELVDDADRALAKARLTESVAHPGRPVHAELNLRSGATSRLHEVTICSLLDDPAVEGVVLNYRDVTQRVQFQRQLERQAYEDVLTGLPNRAHLQDAIVRISREHDDVAVLFIDLDAFKVVNDSLGHAAGDLLLQAVARRLAAGIRTGDLLARLGGDEFTVVVTGERVDSISALADRLIRSLSEPFLLGEQVAFIGASIGIATSRDGERSPIALLRNADAAMYRAKADGRNRHVLFTSTLHEDAVNRLKLETDLRGAINRGEFELHYQPVRSLSSGRIETVEALVRWRTSPDMLVSPNQFIPVAEEVGLMGPIGRWVLREACRQRVHWGNQDECTDDLAISVNLSPRQFNDATLVADVAGILSETNLPASLLILEITETAIIGDMHASRTILSELRRMGVRVALDDFGTGYSSLSHLRNLPIDTIKIDRSFVGEMCARTEDALIIEAVITLAHSLGILTIAEGVETSEQLEALHDRGCDSVQGFLLSRPVPGSQVPDMLTVVQAPATLALVQPPAKLALVQSPAKRSPRRGGLSDQIS